MLNNFIYAQEKDLFLEQLNAGNILDEAIVFIEDTKEIWNHGHYFGGDCGFDPTAFSNLQTAVSQIQTEFLPKSGGTIDGDLAVTGELAVRDFGADFATISTAVGDIADFGSLILHDSNNNTLVDFFHTNKNLATINKNVSITTATNPALSISSNEQGYALRVEQGEAAFVDGITVGNALYPTHSMFYSSIDVKSNLKVDGTFSALGTLTVGRKTEDGDIDAFVDVDGSLQTTGQLIADEGVIGYGTSNFNNLKASNVDAATASISDVEIVNLTTDFIIVNDAIKFDGTPEIKYRSAHDEDTLFEVFNVRDADEKLSMVYGWGNHASAGYSKTDANVKCTLGKTTKYYLAGTTSTATNTGGLTFDSGVYHGTTTGYLYGAAFFETSDARYKDFIKDVEVDFDQLKLIPKKYFTWNNSNDKTLHIGTSAQEVQKIYPELVSEDDKLHVDYAKLSIIALAAIDKLHEENKELKDRLKQLERKVYVNV